MLGARNINIYHVEAGFKENPQAHARIRHGIAYRVVSNQSTTLRRDCDQFQSRYSSYPVYAIITQSTISQLCFDSDKCNS